MIVFPKAATPKDFVKSFLPQAIMDRITNSINSYKFEMMDAYLTSIGVRHTTYEVLITAVKYLEIKEVNDVYIIEVSNIMSINGYTLKQLVNIIDYGSAEVKGTMVYRDTEDWVNNNKAILLTQYSL